MATRTVPGRLAETTALSLPVLSAPGAQFSVYSGPGLYYSVIHKFNHRIIMAANQLVQARVDGAIKQEAAAVLAARGLIVSDCAPVGLTKGGGEKARPCPSSR